MSNNKNKKKEEKKFSSINLCDERIIYLNGDIDDDKAKEIIEKLLKLDMLNHKDIKLFINSKGGIVSSGFAIYDVMNYIKSNVITICVGKCASMAAILLLNGAKGKRTIMSNAEVMIHEVSSVAFGKITEMHDDLKHSTCVNKKILNIIAKKTNMKMNEIKKIIYKKDVWLNSKKALKYGFVDGII